jgi:hypothetical protein
MADQLTISVVKDEPGNLVVVGEARSVVLRNGGLYTNFHYYGQRNKGEWIDLAPLGNRIPDEW